MTVPSAKKVPVTYSQHGIERIDNYAWLRDDERTDPEMLAYLKAENEYKESMLADVKDFREELFQEIKSKIKEDDSSVPFFYNQYWYYNRFEIGKEYALHCRKKGSLDAEEEIILDENSEAKNSDYYTVGGISVSPDNRFMAYSVDLLGRTLHDIRVRSLENGELIDELSGTFENDIVWCNDNLHIFYIYRDPQTLRSFRVFRHKIGDNKENDVLVFEEKDEEFHLSLSKSKSKNYIFIFSQSTDSTETLLLDANTTEAQPVVFYPRLPEHLYYIDEFDGIFYFRSNLFLRDFGLWKCTFEDRDDELKWQSTVDNFAGTPIIDFDIFENKIVFIRRNQGIAGLFILENDTEKKINFDEELISVNLGFNPDYAPPSVRFGLNSMTTPGRVMEYHFSSGEQKCLKINPVLGDFRPENYESIRFWATARDGAKIPVSLVYHKNTPPDGKNPLYLYGYGSYGICLDPYFSIARLSLLNRGFVYAIAHIRGGEELGFAWYDNGRLKNKKNTFNDFIDCAKQLSEAGYADKEKIFASGGSAGGLLISAVINDAPEVFRAVGAHVPFTDVVTTMLDESLPLTTFEYGEWGNPNEKEAFEYMLSYSPYDNIKSQSYPHILVTAGLHDSQVQYFEPAKWVAKLREMKTDNNMLLFHVNMEAGHWGGSGRFEKIKDTALEYAFFLKILGIRK